MCLHPSPCSGHAADRQSAGLPAGGGRHGEVREEVHPPLPRHLQVQYSTVQYSTVQFTLRYLATSSFLLGFLTILLAPSAPLIYLGRFLTGAGMGAVMATATIYIVEIASTVVLSNFDIDVQ